MPEGSEWAESLDDSIRRHELKMSRARKKIIEFAVEEAYSEAILKVYDHPERGYKSWSECEQIVKEWASSVLCGVEDFEGETANLFGFTECDYYVILGNLDKVREFLEMEGTIDKLEEQAYNRYDLYDIDLYE